MQRRFGNQVPPSERRPVAWYAPAVLWQAGRELLRSQDFLHNLDRRESFAALSVIDLSARPASADAPFWFDFVADTGDSGNATFAVASALLRRELHATDDAGRRHVLPEGELLVLGGDLAYPGASHFDYQYRFLEPLTMARDPASRFSASSSPRKFVVAIPQNHDWFDSASTFCRYFVDYDRNLVIGARTPQRQTYFALRLAQDWWVLGFDWALSGDLDRNQFEGFAALLDPAHPAGIGRGANVLLVYPEPYWTRPLGDGAPEGYPHRYQRLEALIEAAGARIRLRIAGDLHHYRRESLLDPATGSETHLVTCGTGGAFCHPTHGIDVHGSKAIDRAPETGAVEEELAHRVRIGRVPRRDERQPRFAPRCAWPAPALTRAMAWRNLWAMFTVHLSMPFWQMPWRRLRHEMWQSNLGFALCIGALYGINAYVNSFVFTESFHPDGFAPMQRFDFTTGAGLWLRAMVFSPFATGINLAMLGGCIRNAWEGPAHWSSRLASGFLHGMAHGFCIYALYWAACHAMADALPPQASLFYGLLTWTLVGLAGVVVGGLLFGVYLALMSGLFGQLPNNAFSSIAHEGHKGFLRCSLDEHGLTVRFVGRVRMPRRWIKGDGEPAGWRIVDSFRVPR